MMHHILIADGDCQTRDLILRYAEHDGFAVTEAATGEQALELCQTEHFDALVLDINLPGADGFYVCMELRRDPKTAKLPILFCTERAEEYDRIHGFEVGCDDYIIKPFSPRELMLRIKAVLRRAENMDGSRLFEYRTLSVNLTARTVEVGRKKVNLSPKEYELLSYLIENRGIVLERNRLIDEIWGEDFYGDPRTLDTHIKKLRHALGIYGRMIVTLRGVGYRFEA